MRVALRTVRRGGMTEGAVSLRVSVYAFENRKSDGAIINDVTLCTGYALAMNIVTVESNIHEISSISQ